MSRFAHELQPGDSLEALRFTVTAEWNEQYCYAQADYDPRYVEARGDAPPEVHPGLLLAMSANTKSPSFVLAPGTGSVLARQWCKFMRCARVGEALEVRFEVVEVYERAGRSFQVVESVVTNSTGDVVLRRQSHLTFPSAQ